MRITLVRCSSASTPPSSVSRRVSGVSPGSTGDHGLLALSARRGVCTTRGHSHAAHASASAAVLAMPPANHDSRVARRPVEGRASIAAHPRRKRDVVRDALLRLVERAAQLRRDRIVAVGPCAVAHALPSRCSRSSLFVVFRRLRAIAISSARA